MKLVLLALVFVFSPIWALDTIFSKGGTCMYKIYGQYQRCMDRQKARLTKETEDLEPITTRAKLIDSVNKISCCAYWEFLSCVEEVANEHCPNERHDMEAYTRQLGSAVPVDICQEQYPRYETECNSSSSGFLPSLLYHLGFLLIAASLL